MILKIIIEILVLWICYVLYMAVLVHKRGPIGGIFFYPKVMQERVIDLGLITREELKKRRIFAYILLFAWMLVILGIMVLCINGARSYWECCWQFYVLFLGTEFFDWLVIDIIWVAKSDWWLIPGTEDLDATWHSVHVKRWKMLKLIPAAVLLSAVVGGLYWVCTLIGGTIITILLAMIMMAGLFLMLYSGVALIQNRRFFSSAPKEVQSFLQDKDERFRGQHFLGWVLVAVSIVLMIGAVVYGAWNGIHNDYTFWQFFIRFAVMFLLLKAYDILFFDWYLLCRSSFFQRYYPEVAPYYGPHLFGYNKKSHMIQIVIFIAVAAVLAWVCTLL